MIKNIRFRIQFYIKIRFLSFFTFFTDTTLLCLRPRFSCRVSAARKSWLLVNLSHPRCETPYVIIQFCLLGFTGAVFHGFLPPEGDLTTKLTMYNNSQTCKHNKKTKFWCSLSFQNIIRRSPQASPTKNWKIKSAVKEKIRDLSSSSKIFERDTYKGGRGALAPRPPL